MRELGEHTESMHHSLVAYITEHVDEQHDVEFFLVGPYMEKYIVPSLQKKYPTYHSLSSRKMGETIRKILSDDEKKPTIVYVK